MTRTEIIAAYEDFDQTIKNFGKEIHKFKADMYAKSEEIAEIVAEIGTKWQRNGYDAFKKNMGNKISNIQNSLDRCENLSGKLNDLSNLLHVELEKLREGN